MSSCMTYKEGRNAEMRILVSVLMAIGDGVYATAAFASLKKAWPDCKLTVLVSPALAEFMENNCYADDYIVARGDTKGTLYTVLELRKQRFDMGICFDGRTKTLAVMWLGGVKNIVYVEGMYSRIKPLKRFFSTSIVGRDAVVLQKHVVYQYRNIIEKITAKSGASEINIGELSAKNVAHARKLMTGLADASGPVVAVAAHSSTEAKNWDIQKLADTLKIIAGKYSVRLYFVGAQADKEYSQAIIDRSGVKALNLCGETSLKDMAALFCVTACIVSVCTGPVHVAAAMKLPAVMIYTCSSFRTWYPFGVDFIPVCSFEKCATGFCDSKQCVNFKCVNSLSTEDVVLAFDSLIRTLPKKRG